jgi:hypothetical protein
MKYAIWVNRRNRRLSDGCPRTHIKRGKRGKNKNIAARWWAPAFDSFRPIKLRRQERQQEQFFYLCFLSFLSSILLPDGGHPRLIHSDR